jgi:hypothetical protein
MPSDALSSPTFPGAFPDTFGDHEAQSFLPAESTGGNLNQDALLATTTYSPATSKTLPRAVPDYSHESDHGTRKIVPATSAVSITSDAQACGDVSCSFAGDPADDDGFVDVSLAENSGEFIWTYPPAQNAVDEQALPEVSGIHGFS